MALGKGRQSLRIPQCRLHSHGSVLDWPASGYGEVCSAVMQKDRCSQAWEDQLMVYSLLGNGAEREENVAKAYVRCPNNPRMTNRPQVLAFLVWNRKPNDLQVDS